MSVFPSASKIDKLASQCVKCGLCLPHCPTYQITSDENESPRGRIALFQALSQEKLPLSTHLQKHLDLCLGCRACEAVCPAHVKYGKLLITGRAHLNNLNASPMHFQARFLMWVLRYAPLRKILHYLLWFLEQSKLRMLARKAKLTALLRLTYLDTLLPKVSRPKSFANYYAAIEPKRGEVMLFTGCTSSLCDQETITASIYVLRSFGYDIHIPPQQTCCGAMDLHAGHPDKAFKLAQQNQLAFGNIDSIVTLATGCSAVLQELDMDFSSDPQKKQTQAITFSSKIIDIMDFIAKQEWPTSITLKPIPKRVKLHTPCSRRYVLKTPQSPLNVLSKIPQLQVESFQTTSCCGAAGTYMVEHPEMAHELVEKLLSELGDIPVDIVATSNIGCQLHIQQELNKRNLAIKVCHPVMLLASALDFKIHATNY